MRLIAVLTLLLALFSNITTTQAFDIQQTCPGAGVQPRTTDFTPGGIILTYFDNTSIWVYNIDSDRRYPLPDTRPCNTNCRLSPDARWITYMNPINLTYAKMRLDGTQRTLLVEYANDVEWWQDATLLVWTPGHRAYLQPEGGTEREYLNVEGIISVQPGGRWGLQIQQNGDSFRRSLLNLESRDLQGIAEQRINLGEEKPYFSAAHWSPDGSALAYTAPVIPDSAPDDNSAELFLAHPATGETRQLTDLYSIYGSTRINGRNSTELSWSPDSTRIAFWAIELIGPEPEADTGRAVIHVSDVQTGTTRVYCDFTTDQHTPNPPRLIWSPDGTHLALSANTPGDDKGYLLLALNLETGVFTELSNGVYPVFGEPQLIAWGLPPQ